MVCYVSAIHCNLLTSSHIGLAGNPASTPVSIPRQRCYTDPYGNGSAASLAGSVPDRQTSSSAPATGYFAGSVFQNSPSPDEIPAPSFAV
ncbi:hypothetical protein NUW54_g1638 [Trametes sanguinea]|uniref:Uncharacterized protein n=1 Tax=Trametes sanguinea TaxID=158606 RepID=A0ACC1Q8G2_9APHY|nr:hypothetical protein NUW54_g1638 [Trametes sanguinea]